MKNFYRSWIFRASMLPVVKESSEYYGETDKTIFAERIPIAGIAGDQHAALFGQMCLEKGMVKNTYGTGCFMLMNIGDQFVESKNNLLTTVAWKINGQIQYAFEGSIFIAGAVVQWLRDGLGIIRNSSEIETLATQVEDTGWGFFCSCFCRSRCSLLESGCQGNDGRYHQRNKSSAYRPGCPGIDRISNHGCIESNGSRCRNFNKRITGGWRRNGE